jgi:hypothetical protein
MNPKEAILKIKALFEDMPKQEEAPVEEVKAAEFAEYSLADGTKVMISSLEVGGEVKLEDGSNAPDGEHQLADGTQISTLEGKIVEIEKAEEPAQENVDVEVESKKMEKKMEEMAAEFQSKISDMEIMNAALIAKLEALENKSKTGFSQVVELIEEMSKVPQADPIEMPQSFKFEATKDIKFERLNKYRNAILNNKN